MDEPPQFCLTSFDFANFSYLCDAVIWRGLSRLAVKILFCHFSKAVFFLLAVIFKQMKLESHVGSQMELKKFLKIH